jgi:hypothetical protein
MIAKTYKQRNLIERCVNRLKQFRRIATRYEKTAKAFVSMLCIAAARLCIKTVDTAPSVEDWILFPPKPYQSTTVSIFGF